LESASLTRDQVSLFIPGIGDKKAAGASPQFLCSAWVSSWPVSTVRGAATSRRLLGVDRTYRGLREIDAVGPQTKAALRRVSPAAVDLHASHPDFQPAQDIPTIRVSRGSSV